MPGEAMTGLSAWADLPTSRYFLSHSVGLPPAAARRAYEADIAAPWRAGGDPWAHWEQIPQRYRTALARLLHARPEDICPQANVSSALSKFVFSLPDRGRRRVLRCSGDFPSTGYVLGQLERRGYAVEAIPASFALAEPEAWFGHLREDVELLHLTHVFSNTGLKLPVKEIAAQAKKAGIRVVVDAAQSAGVVPIDVGDWQADAVVGTAVKYLCGGPGAGWLWVAAETGVLCAPLDVGWFSHAEPFAFDAERFDYAKGAARFAGGTPAVGPMAVAAAGVEAVLAVGPDTILAHVGALVARLKAQLPRGAILSHTVPNQHGAAMLIHADDPAAAAEALRREGFALDHRGRGLRISFHAYTAAGDIDALASALYPLIQSGGGGSLPRRRTKAMSRPSWSRSAKPWIADGLSRENIRADLATRPRFHRLDKNENLFPFTAAEFEEFRASLTPDLLYAYPDLSGVYAKLAKSEGVEEDNLLLATGSDLAVKLIFDAFVGRGDRVVTHSPSYFMFDIYARGAGAHLASADMTDDLVPSAEALMDLVDEKTKLVIVEDPSGFVGTRMDKADLHMMAVRLHGEGCVLLIDEAYHYVGGGPSRNLSLLQDYDNVIITRTFSKAHGLAGARAGFAMANPELMGYISKLRPLYEISALTAHALEWHLSRPEMLTRAADRIAAARARALQILPRHGFVCRDGHANFVLVRHETMGPAELTSKLAASGILVRRPFAHGLIEEWVRVSLSVPEDADRVAAAVAAAPAQRKEEALS